MTVTIPELYMCIFSCTYHVMSVLYEFDICNWKFMSEYCLDTMSKVQIPESDILINTWTDQNSIIRTDIECCDRQFMSIKFQKWFSSVSIEQMDLTIVKTYSIFFEVWCVTCRSNLLIKIFCCDLFHFNTFVLVITDFIHTKNIVPP